MTAVIVPRRPCGDTISMQTWTEILMTDHETTERVFAAFERALGGTTPPSTTVVADALDYFTGYVERCHNHKEEDHLFPLAEQRGVPRSGGPLAVMIGEHRSSEEALAAFRAAATAYIAGHNDALPALAGTFKEYSEILKQHFWKENDILFPLARRVLQPGDDQIVLDGIAAVEAAAGPDTRERYYALAAQIVTACDMRDLSENLPPEILGAMLNTLPIELSFVDAEDRVRYFSHENHPKIFGRTRGAIGRVVQQCHPPRSVHMVNAILAAFRAGERSVAEFWLTLGGRMVHVRYFAVRSAEGNYMGCLESVQDITEIQKLTGERRLLNEALA
jgi:DUF438 domain-containing protein